MSCRSSRRGQFSPYKKARINLPITEKLFLSDVKASVRTKENKKGTKKWQRKHNPRNISRVPRAHTEIFFGPSPNEAVYDVWATGAPRNKHDARTALASSRIGLGTLGESPTRASPVKVSTGAPARKHAAVSPRVWPHTRRSMDRACSSDKAEEKKKIFYSTPETCSVRVERPRRVGVVLNNDPC